jgi:hypothetical protein
MPLVRFFEFILFLINAVVVPLIFAVAFLMFVFGIAQGFIFNAGDPKKREDGRKFAVWGIIAFFIMVSVWGLVNILVGTFGFGGQSRPPLPGFGSPGGFQGSNTDNGGFSHSAGLGESCKPPGPGCKYGLACNTATYICVHPEDI